MTGGAWPQPGDDALVVRQRGFGAGNRAYDITRTKVARLTARDVVLEDGTRMRRASQGRDGRFMLRSGAWEPSIFVMAPTDPQARKALIENRLTSATNRLRRAALTVDEKARAGDWAENVTAADIEAVTAAWAELQAARAKAGLPAAVPAAGPGHEDDDGQDDDEPQDRMDDQP